ncbi:MAG: CaiB/BaiF CoA-transferase family protein [Zwartia sp.]|nr:CaiB/BaiF CoA-transferase family protein [Zwartia sp.]
MMQPLEGVKVLDFSTLLPGPMCTLLLAEAGADVIKIERASGDDMRDYSPKVGADSVNFSLLNRGKKSIIADLKDTETIEKIKRLIADTDVIVEQFRPGVMDRLGLGYEAVSQINPGIVYCSITGFGQSGPSALIAAHDMNYQARAGMVALSADAQGAPFVPPVLTADLAGGAYPAVMNILLGLRKRDLDGRGCHLDVSMADNLFTLMYWGLGNGWAANEWPAPGNELVTGGSPRYQVYQTSDDKFLAAAPLEEKFWTNFLTLIGLTELQSAQDDLLAKACVAKVIAQRTAAEWMRIFEGHDVCVTEVVGLEQATKDPHFVERGVFKRTLTASGGTEIPALPVPLSPVFLGKQTGVASPSLGQHTQEILK